jgi:hypothetical protein
MRKLNYYNNIINTLKELHKLFPNYNIGKHISTAIDGQDMWGMPDKELLSVLIKYKRELESNKVPDTDEYEMQRIIEDGMHLDSILEEEED